MKIWQLGYYSKTSKYILKKTQLQHNCKQSINKRNYQLSNSKSILQQFGQIQFTIEINIPTIFDAAEAV